MLNKYEKAIIENLMDILETEDLKSAPAGRTIIFDGQYEFHLVSTLFGSEIVLSWKDRDGDGIVTIDDWKKRWALVVDTFAMTIRSVVEG